MAREGLPARRVGNTPAAPVRPLPVPSVAAMEVGQPGRRRPGAVPSLHRVIPAHGHWLPSLYRDVTITGSSLRLKYPGGEWPKARGGSAPCLQRGRRSRSASLHPGNSCGNRKPNLWNQQALGSMLRVARCVFASQKPPFGVWPAGGLYTPHSGLSPRVSGHRQDGAEGWRGRRRHRRSGERRR